MQNDKIKEYWEGEAGIYSEGIKAELKSETAENWKNLILEYAPEKEHLEVLDVGCGPGFFEIMLGKEGHHVTGIDITENMIHEAKENDQAEVIVWGSGNPKREFLYVDEMAAASVYVMELNKDVYNQFTEPMLSHINVGTGRDCSIKELASAIASVVGYKGKITFDSTKPDGTPRKLLDVSRLAALGWTSKLSLHDGLVDTYQWYLDNQDTFRR